MYFFEILQPLWKSREIQTLFTLSLLCRGIFATFSNSREIWTVFAFLFLLHIYFDNFFANFNSERNSNLQLKATNSWGVEKILPPYLMVRAKQKSCKLWSGRGSKPMKNFPVNYFILKLRPYFWCCYEGSS